MFVAEKKVTKLVVKSSENISACYFCLVYMWHVLFFLKHASLCVSQGQQREDGQQQGFEWILQGQEWWKWMHSAR